MPTCANCGTDNLAQAKFCKQCGSTLSVTSTGKDTAELLANAQRAKEESERGVQRLQAELDVKGREITAALEKVASLERDLASVKAQQGSVETEDRQVHDALRKLRTEKDQLSGALAGAATRIKDLEHRLEGELGRVKTISGWRRWLTPTLSAALALVTGIAGFDYWRGGTLPTDSGREVQELREALETAKQRAAGLQDEIAISSKSPPSASDGTAAAALAAREARVRQAEEANTKRAADLDTQARKIADERRALDAARTELKNAPLALANPAAPFGFLLWQGRVQVSTDVFITGSQASGGGTATGTLPGRRCDLRIERVGARVTIEPGPKNNWNQAVIAPEPGRVATVLFVWTCQGK